MGRSGSGKSTLLNLVSGIDRADSGSIRIDGREITSLADAVRDLVNDGDTGRLATFLQWLDSPANWLGMHKVLEVVPASLALFALSIAGNSLYIYCSDRLRKR